MLPLPRRVPPSQRNPSCWAVSFCSSPASSFRFKVCQFFWFVLFGLLPCAASASIVQPVLDVPLLLLLNFYCSCFPFIASGRSTAHLRLLLRPALLCPLPFRQRQLPNSVTLQLHSNFDSESVCVSVSNCDSESTRLVLTLFRRRLFPLTFTLFDFSHMSYQRLFPRGLRPLAG